MITVSFIKEAFVLKVIKGTKVHTIREDKSNKYFVGAKLELCRHKPTTAGADDSYKFASAVVKKIKPIQIINEVEVSFRAVYVDSFRLTGTDLLKFVKNDGFENIDSFFEYFHFPKFEGKLIEWRQLKTYKR